MQDRRRFLTGMLTVAGAGVAHRASAQNYPPPPFEGERRYGGGREEDEDRRFEERRREGEERRREYYERRGRPDSVVGLEQERNRRVLGLQQELARGQISRRDFNERVAEIDFELHRRLGQ